MIPSSRDFGLAEWINNDSSSDNYFNCLKIAKDLDHDYKDSNILTVRPRPISSSADDQRAMSPQRMQLNEQQQMSKKPQVKAVQGRRKITLHWTFKYIAWLLCFVCILGSFYILWLYAISFGDDRTQQWLTSLLLSFFLGLLLFEPIKVGHFTGISSDQNA